MQEMMGMMGVLGLIAVVLAGIFMPIAVIVIEHRLSRMQKQMVKVVRELERYNRNDRAENNIEHKGVREIPIKD